MNMDKTQNIAEKVITTIPKSISVTSQIEGQFNVVAYRIDDLALPFTGSMAVRINTGFLRVKINLHNSGILFCYSVLLTLVLLLLL